MSEIDFEAEGLLAGLEGEPREARRRLLTELAEDGVPLEELRRAVAEDRLVLLPVERVLSGGGGRYTAAEIAQRAGL
ncbi:MAG: adenylate/guanylate cyclase domain-containing protein, partial [Solirubrobacterales bacterium]|nr:adenylate/guanylate cyclase domain-containing protein [Solirubrobacterales bacterium]